jgi:hypothetical protein
MTKRGKFVKNLSRTITTSGAIRKIVQVRRPGVYQLTYFKRGHRLAMIGLRGRPA